MYRVLVVDDAAFMLKVVEKALTPYNYDFEIVGYANNGIAGLKKYEELMPDVVVLDITMPEMDGLEMASRLFKKYLNPNIVMLSALGGYGPFVEKAKEIGITHFLKKPFKDGDLVNALYLQLQQQK